MRKPKVQNRLKIRQENPFSQFPSPCKNSPQVNLHEYTFQVLDYAQGKKILVIPRLAHLQVCSNLQNTEQRFTLKFPLQ